MLVVLFGLGCSLVPPPDVDGDGVTADLDCDDTDPFVLPGAAEICDGVDNDCNGQIDDAPIDELTWYPDDDLDSYAAPEREAEGQSGCRPGPEWAPRLGDCNDQDPAVNPGAQDRCNAVDDNCDGIVDDEPDDDRWIDEDGDGFGDPRRFAQQCEGAQVASQAGDCNDADANVFPGAGERCNGQDDDCDERIDDEDLEDLTDAPTWYPDQDGDGFGVAGVLDLVQCEAPALLWSTESGDCNDLSAETFPGALELCAGEDNNCDGALPDETGWFDPSSPARVPLTVRASAAGAEDPVVIGDQDFATALADLGLAGTFDPATLVAVVQSCDVGGHEVPVGFADGLVDLMGAGDPTDALGDGEGSVHIVLDGVTLAPSQEIDLALYFGGPARVATGTLVADSRGWASAAGEVVIDPDRGGLLDDLLPDGVINVLSQADSLAGNGVHVDGAWRQVNGVGAATSAVEEGPELGVVSSDITHEGLSYRSWWWGYSAHPAVFGKLVLEVTETVTVSDPGGAELAVRPFQVTAPGLSTAVTTAGPDWVGWSGANAGVALGWVVPPAEVSELTCASDTCWTAAAERGLAGTSAVLDPGDVLVDHRVLMVLPTRGDPSLDGRLSGLLSPPTVQWGAPEAQ